MASLRETARLYTAHYSIMIEGNRLSLQEVERIIEHQEHFPGRLQDEGEIKGYYAALGIWNNMWHKIVRLPKGPFKCCMPG